MKNFFVSSLAFADTTPENMVRLAIQRNIAIEFSSGIPYRAGMAQFYLDAPVEKRIHNYFPAPEVPFVLNLASTNETIRKQSVNHCLYCLELAQQAGLPYYSAHAGFCIDPRAEDLGKQLQTDVYFDRDKHWRLFKRSVREILETARQLNIGFLIENNVIASFNMPSEDRNPLLCCTSEEMLKLIEEIANPDLGLLLDTAHLKVSALTLGLNAELETEMLRQHIRCIHHSDNDGMADTNESLQEGYWFKKFMPWFTNIDHVLEVKKIPVDHILKQKEILQ